MGAVCENRLFAVGLFNYSIDKETFKAWMEQLLIPALPKNIANCFIFSYGIEVKLATLTQYSVVLCMKD